MVEGFGGEISVCFFEELREGVVEVLGVVRTLKRSLVAAFEGFYRYWLSMFDTAANGIGGTRAGICGVVVGMFCGTVFTVVADLSEGLEGSLICMVEKWSLNG